MALTVSIVGYGWVGKAMEKLFPDAYIYDPLVGKGDNPMLVNKADICFVSVPTPNYKDTEKEQYKTTQIGEPFNNCGEGKLDTSIVEECISWITCPLIVVRSTVNPGDCDRWSEKYNRNIVMQPEYLGETPNHPFLDPKTRQFLILGGEPKDIRKLIELYTTVYNANITIRQVSKLEAELIKLSENRAIGMKVLECQELYDVCELAKVDYYTIRDAVYGDDPRFNLWFTFIFPDKRGINSKCMPKDIYAWCAFAESLGYTPKITRSALERNKKWISPS